MESYPSILPAPLRDSYSLANTPNIRRSQFASGRIRQRKLDNTTRMVITPTFRFNQSQFSIFAGWHKHKISDGADQFTINLHGLNGLHTQTAQMISGEYSSRFNDGFWDVTTTLEVFNPVAITESDLNAELS